MNERRKLTTFMATPFLYLTIIAAIISSLPSPSPASAVYDLRWEIVSRSNFSSAIRMHPNLLLMVTLPWLGESRSLMKDLAERIATEKEEYGSPKLMILYRNRERMLADAIGASDGITIIFYHNSLPYKYQGRLRSQNILSSLQYLISCPSEQLPIQSLNTQGDLKTFLQSTDKAVLLLEFCGWTQQLLTSGRKNGTTNDFESNGSLAALWRKDQTFENERMTCDAQNGFNGIPWLEELSSFSQSEANKSFIHEVSCSLEKFQHFDTFLTKFVTVAREFFLPPERLRFGLLTDKSLLSTLEYEDASSWLSSLNVDSDSWLMTVHFSGCHTCSLILRERDDLKSAVQMQNPFVTELGDGDHDTDPTLPANKPSILLFVDRSSDSFGARRKSKETLDAFRSLAFQYHEYNGVGSQLSYETHPQVKSFSHNQNKKLSSASRKFVSKDKVSIRVINEGKHVTLDKITSGLQGNSLHEILAYVLRGEKEVKLSSLAKQAGFQLLSEDFDVKVQEALPAQTKETPESDQSEDKVLPEANVDLHKNEIPNIDDNSLEKVQEALPAQTKETPESDQSEDKVLPEANVDLHKNEIPNIVDNSLENDEQKTNYPDKSSDYTTFETSTQPSGVSVDLHGSRGFDSTKEEVDMDEKLPSKGFTGSFFFSDGGYQLLRALTGDLKIPSVVIVDPTQQKHYILNGETDFSLSALSEFVNGFANGSLIPYQKSESGVKAPVQAPSPPFVNLDFRVTDSIPQLISNAFTELVIGFNQSDNATWKKDVMVLFSNSWCGFCRRMELVVREVYKVFKHYGTMLNVDAFGDTKSRLPQFYFMDCTLNECSLILRSVAQRENYPHLLLFPAESKVAVSYEGDIVVSDIIKFVIDYGNEARNLVKEKGTLSSGVERENRMEGSYDDVALFQLDEHREVLLEHRIPEEEVRPKPKKTRNPIYRAATQVGIGSLLIATEKVLNVHPFDNSVILIVNVHEDTGIQGLIINKHISWVSFKDLEEGLEELLKDAQLSLGGPLMQEGMPFVALTRENMSNHYPEVLPNIHFLDQLATIREIQGLALRKHLVTNFWFFFGYSSWCFDQLFNEIKQGAWNITSPNYEDINWPWR